MLTDPQRRVVDDAATALRAIATQLANIQTSLLDVPRTGVVRDGLYSARLTLAVEREALLNLLPTDHKPTVDTPHHAG